MVSPPINIDSYGLKWIYPMRLVD